MIKGNFDFLTIKEATGKGLTSPEHVFDSMKAESKIDRECGYVLHVNGQNRVIKKELVAMGTGTSGVLNPREVFRRAIIEGAISIIIVHNHPSGNPSPSDADKETSKRLKEAGYLLGVPVVDFLIIADTFYSFAEHNEGGF